MLQSKWIKLITNVVTLENWITHFDIAQDFVRAPNMNIQCWRSHALNKMLIDCLKAVNEETEKSVCLLPRSCALVNKRKANNFSVLFGFIFVAFRCEICFFLFFEQRHDASFVMPWQRVDVKVKWTHKKTNEKKRVKSNYSNYNQSTPVFMTENYDLNAKHLSLSDGERAQERKETRKKTDVQQTKDDVDDAIENIPFRFIRIFNGSQASSAIVLMRTRARALTFALIHLFTSTWREFESTQRKNQRRTHPTNRNDKRQAITWQMAERDAWPSRVSFNDLYRIVVIYERLWQRKRCRRLFVYIFWVTSTTTTNEKFDGSHFYAHSNSRLFIFVSNCLLLIFFFARKPFAKAFFHFLRFFVRNLCCSVCAWIFFHSFILVEIKRRCFDLFYVFGPWQTTRERRKKKRRENE